MTAFLFSMSGFSKIVIALGVLLFAQSVNADWKKIPSGTFAWLHSIQFVNEQRGFIVGGNGAFLQTTDGGKSWTIRKRFTDDAILDLYFSNEKTGWLLCERDIFANSSASPTYLMQTQDGGESWKRIEIGDERNRMVRMFFSQSGEGIVVGEGGAILSLRSGNTAWLKSSLPVRYLMLDGRFFDNAKAVVVGGGGTILFTEDDGRTWLESNVFGASPAKLFAVCVYGKSYGWSVGAKGTILMTQNAGRIWRAQVSGTTHDLLDVVFTSTSEGWVFGDAGTILHTTTAGNVWNVVETQSRHRIESAVFVGSRGFAVGFGGTILSFDSKANPVDVKSPKPILRNRNG